MATIVKTIGTAGGRDYSTLAAWEAGLPANLVTDGNSYEGDAYNDSEFTAGITFAAHTTDATHTITLTTGAGQSFQNNANVRTNPLKYDATKGVGVTNSTSYGINFNINNSVNNLTISKFQIKQTVNNGYNIYTNASSASYAWLMKDLIIENTGSTGAINMCRIEGNTTKYVNVICIKSGTDTALEVFYFHTDTGAACINCAAVRGSNRTAGGSAFAIYKYAGNGSKLVNCASFGFTKASDNQGVTTWGTSNNNATDQASMTGTSNQTSVSYTSATPFTSADTSGSYNFIPIASTALAGNGSKDATNAPNDITGTVRASACTIGVWELSASTPTTATGDMMRIGMSF